MNGHVGQTRYTMDFRRSISLFGILTRDGKSCFLDPSSLYVVCLLSDIDHRGTDVLPFGGLDSGYLTST